MTVLLAGKGKIAARLRCWPEERGAATRQTADRDKQG